MVDREKRIPRRWACCGRLDPLWGICATRTTPIGTVARQDRRRTAGTSCPSIAPFQPVGVKLASETKLKPNGRCLARNLEHWNAESDRLGGLNRVLALESRHSPVRAGGNPPRGDSSFFFARCRVVPSGAAIFLRALARTATLFHQASSGSVGEGSNNCSTGSSVVTMHGQAGSGLHGRA